MIGLETLVLAGTGTFLLGATVGALSIIKGMPFKAQRLQAEIIETTNGEKRKLNGKHPLDKEPVSWHDLMDYCRTQHMQRDRLQVERFDALRRYLDERFDNLINQMHSIKERLDRVNGKI